MKLLIEKKSGKKFPPPFDGEGFTAIAVGLCELYLKEMKND